MERRHSKTNQRIEDILVDEKWANNLKTEIGQLE